MNFRNWAALLGLQIASVSALHAQAFASGSYSHQFVAMPKLNGIMQTFNTRENHQLADFSALSGYHFSAGNYASIMMIELGYSNIVQKRESHTPNQLRETAEVIANFSAATFHAGIRPFRRHYLTFGAGFNFGVSRVRYSFGGNYQTPVKVYGFAPELFVDYGLKIKFLVRKSLRDKTFYMIRIRPFYQAHFQMDMVNAEKTLNNNPTAKASDFVENWSNFGIRVGLVVPLNQPESEADELLVKEKKKKKRVKRHTISH